MGRLDTVDYAEHHDIPYLRAATTHRRRRLRGWPFTVIAGRKKDVIITGDENVSSIEVEDCLFQPGFAERLIAGGTRASAEALAQRIGAGIELTGRRKK